MRYACCFSGSAESLCSYSELKYINLVILRAKEAIDEKALFVANVSHGECNFGHEEGGKEEGGKRERGKRNQEDSTKAYRCEEDGGSKEEFW
jgi:hypothetical protein